VAIEVPAQRLEIGDVVLLHLPGKDATVDAKLVRDIERTPTIVRARVRVAQGEDFLHERALGDFVTVVRGP
jgi:hypothetical protein